MNATETRRIVHIQCKMSSNPRSPKFADGGREGLAPLRHSVPAPVARRPCPLARRPIDNAGDHGVGPYARAREESTARPSPPNQPKPR